MRTDVDRCGSSPDTMCEQMSGFLLPSGQLQRSDVCRRSHRSAKNKRAIVTDADFLSANIGISYRLLSGDVYACATHETVLNVWAGLHPGPQTFFFQVHHYSAESLSAKIGVRDKARSFESDERPRVPPDNLEPDPPLANGRAPGRLVMQSGCRPIWMSMWTDVDERLMVPSHILRFRCSLSCCDVDQH